MDVDEASVLRSEEDSALLIVGIRRTGGRSRSHSRTGKQLPDVSVNEDVLRELLPGRDLSEFAAAVTAGEQAALEFEEEDT